jgi:hypothetical protein
MKILTCVGALLIVGLVVAVVALASSRTPATTEPTATNVAGAAIVAHTTVSAETVTVSTQAPATSTEAPTTTTTAKSSFVDGVLTTPEVIIKITDVKTIPAGATGNEYSENPVIAFWYEITNLTDDDVSPTNWIFVFSAYQDNNPNAWNELDMGFLPDDTFRDSQMETIKKGGTVANAVAYELDDETTPVDLVASEDLGQTEIGRMTYNLE